MHEESLDIQEKMEDRGIQDTLVDKEKLVLPDDQVEMVPMQMQVSALGVREAILKKEKLATQGNQEDVDLLDLKDHQEHLVMMPNAILEGKGKMADLEGLGDLGMMVHLEDLAMMEALETTMT